LVTGVGTSVPYRNFSSGALRVSYGKEIAGSTVGAYCIRPGLQTDNQFSVNIGLHQNSRANAIRPYDTAP